jgi:hypothetical protein
MELMFCGLLPIKNQFVADHQKKFSAIFGFKGIFNPDIGSYFNLWW